MKREDSFMPTDRYVYDFKLCTPDHGFAQVDTSQDASYYGTWANPFTLRIVTYCEGDVCKQQAESAEEFVEAIEQIKQWNEENGHRFIGIDTLCRDNITEGFNKLGLGKFLH